MVFNLFLYSQYFFFLSYARRLYNGGLCFVFLALLDNFSDLSFTKKLPFLSLFSGMQLLSFIHSFPLDFRNFRSNCDQFSTSFNTLLIEDHVLSPPLLFSMHSLSPMNSRNSFELEDIADWDVYPAVSGLQLKFRLINTSKSHRFLGTKFLLEP